MRLPYAVPAILACAVIAAPAQVSISIGINVPVFPELVPVPGEPVYYAPRLDSNYFFFDGLYWVFRSDDWYSSTWYNGPWRRVDRYTVPPPILRVPVRYYRRPPTYFRGWRPEGPPRWGERWGHTWERRRQGWDRRDGRSHSPAPIPDYQRGYSGQHYPQGPQQRELRSQHYSYRPQDPVARKRYQEEERGPAPGRKGRRGP